jgi:hypothetical protein
MRKTLFLTIAATAVLTTACSGAADTVAAPATVTQTVVASAPASAPAPVAAVPTPAPAAVVTAAPSPAAAVVDFAMPDMVGTNLQVAQNTMQENGVFWSVSHDLLGIRKQVMDGNWQVCDQNVPAGNRVTGQVEGAIDFGVVKLEERCP